MSTFFFSALLHEWVLSLLFKSIMPILTVMMLSQIPLFVITRNMHGKKIGNVLVIFGLFFGIPLNLLLYLRLDTNVTKKFQMD